MADILIENRIKTQRSNYDTKSWHRKSILNVARIGKFSTDRTIREYTNEIWGIMI